MATIKRYSNRKLYDIDARRYVTLDEIAEAVRRGEEVTVIDHTTGADLTTVTLLQILFTEEKRIGGMLPEKVLTRFLRLGENNLSSLRSAYNYMTDPRQVVDTAIRQRIKALTAQAALSAEEAQHWLELLLDPDLELPADEAAEDDEAATQDDVHALLRQLDQLDKALDQLKP